ncbi:molybdopterin molybdotransferase MoeA [Geodermatophilus sp. CPCC 205506]|uniref:molybdopterin molybdotransferase MoeA n=1 Tax=Geodermatophilus sp. CPCC 205506 TaxID=2936596 RepID=UPI003EEA3126
MTATQPRAVDDHPSCGCAAPRATTPPAVPADPVAAAFSAWMHTCRSAGWHPAVSGETVTVDAARDRVTSAELRARHPVPAYRAAAMDGIAVTSGPDPREGPVELGPAEFDRVDTGDPVPDGRDAVVMREQVAFLPGGSAVVTGPWPSPGRHLRRIGEDVESGAVVLPAGHRIRPVDAAALAAVGHTTVSVRRRPVVAIVPTGDEIRPIGSSLRPGEILDTNSLMLAGLSEDAGCTALALPVVPDDPDRITAALAHAAERADLVLVIAGSSAGRDDHTGSVLDRLGRVAVRGVAMRPGHPVLLGVLECERIVPAVGVPGYPGSAERAFACFVRPLLDRLLGRDCDPVTERAIPARLAVALRSPEHVEDHVRVRLARIPHPRTAEERLVAAPLPRGAGALTTLVQVEAVLRIPAGTGELPAGTAVLVAPVAGAPCAPDTVVVRGRRSAATEALVDVRAAELPAGAMAWVACPEADAIDSLADGLCHAAALALPLRQGRPDERAIAAYARRLGPITVLEVARTADLVEVLVVPGASASCRPVEGLRAALGSMAFRRRLRDRTVALEGPPRATR